MPRSHTYKHPETKEKIVSLDADECGEIRIWCPPGVYLHVVDSHVSPAGGSEYVLKTRAHP